MSYVRIRVASSDWWASRKVVSVTSSRSEARSAAANFSGPSSSSCWRKPTGTGVRRSIFGSLVRGWTVIGDSPCGLFTVTSASQVSTLVPRSSEVRAFSSAGRSSMKAVEISPARKSGSSSTAWRKGMLVATPRIRNSASARRARATAWSRSRPRVVSFTSRESKWGLITAPVAAVPPSRRTPAPAAER
ncbi:hypothetical protein SDC9_127585 [bioreactor metagenome]|uniref:Uncharacterized protein n=1 Tax=bioreactor metagenome TaxID=1076179 RepID=A0A645CUK1_9ZZZZ